MKEAQRRLITWVLVTLLAFAGCGKKTEAEPPAEGSTGDAAITATSGDVHLSRGVALAMLKQHEANLLPANEYERLEFLREPFALPMLTASAGEMAGTEPFTLPSLDDYQRVVRTASLDPQLRDDFAHQFASGLFFLALQKGEIIQLTELKNTQLTLRATGTTSPVVPATEVRYNRASAPGVEVIWGQHDPYHRSASVQPIVWHFTAITGIAGEGGPRTVQALVQAGPTPSLVRLQEIARAVLRDQGRDETSYLTSCRGRTDDYLCVVLSYRIPPPRTEAIAFQRYDDGWRIVQ